MLPPPLLGPGQALLLSFFAFVLADLGLESRLDCSFLTSLGLPGALVQNLQAPRMVW